MIFQNKIHWFYSFFFVVLFIQHVLVTFSLLHQLFPDWPQISYLPYFVSIFTPSRTIGDAKIFCLYFSQQLCTYGYNDVSNSSLILEFSLTCVSTEDSQTTGSSYVQFTCFFQKIMLPYLMSLYVFLSPFLQWSLSLRCFYFPFLYEDSIVSYSLHTSSAAIKSSSEEVWEIHLLMHIISH